jgi:hypothetical protein
VTLALAGVTVADMVSADVSRTAWTAVPRGGERYSLPFLKNAFKLGPWYAECCSFRKLQCALISSVLYAGRGRGIPLLFKSFRNVSYPLMRRGPGVARVSPNSSI